MPNGGQRTYTGHCVHLMPGEEDRIPELEGELSRRLAERATQQGFLERAPAVEAPDAGDEA